MAVWDGTTKTRFILNLVCVWILLVLDNTKLILLNLVVFVQSCSPNVMETNNVPVRTDLGGQHIFQLYV